MANIINYQKELDKVLADDKNIGRSLLLHSCCAPCSSYVLTYLSSFFDITVFYYNPNITEADEYRKRVLEQKRLINALNEEVTIREWAYGGYDRRKINIIDASYDADDFYKIASGYENEPEGGARCARCFRLRLYESAMMAAKIKADYFGTTLTISPLKNTELINSIGISLEKEINSINGTDIKWLPSDFKKKEGYKHSIELSKEYDLYRQNFCGCEFSKGSTLE